MNTPKRNALVERLSKDEEPLLVPIDEFFDGNDDLGSIGCNLTDHPGIDAFRKKFAALKARADVEAVYARISELDPGPDSWPFSDTVIVFGKISVEELRAILAGLQPDEVVPVQEFGLGSEVTARHGSPALLAWWD